MANYPSSWSQAQLRWNIPIISKESRGSSLVACSQEILRLPSRLSIILAPPHFLKHWQQLSPGQTKYRVLLSVTSFLC